MSQGRGRGRGRGAFQPEPKRPGGNSPVSDIPKSSAAVSQGSAAMDDLVSSINSLSIGTKDIAQTSDVVLRHGCNMDKQELARMVYKRCHENWQMSRTVSLLCKTIIEDPKDGNEFRTAVLSVLQADYNKRAELRNSNKAHYLGCLAFLCQVYANLKDERGEPFTVLLKPVFEAIEILLDNKAEEEEMQCATRQMFTCGKMMQLSDPTRWRQVIQSVRDIILDNRGSRELRSTCIDLVEIAASEWKMSVPAEYQ